MHMLCSLQGMGHAQPSSSGERGGELIPAVHAPNASQDGTEQANVPQAAAAAAAKVQDTCVAVANGGSSSSRSPNCFCALVCCSTVLSSCNLNAL